ncbi:MAG: hypothetical protein RL238_1204 [Actinomycetota bacterium]|jgi:hypothetical protein
MATARRLVLCVLLTLVSVSAAPSVARADASPVVPAAVAEEVQTDIADGSADNTTSTTIVASEGPVPEAKPESGARAPGIGPILVPTAGSSFNGAWWLVAFGGLQLIGLFFITRRARARLSTDDVQP